MEVKAKVKFLRVSPKKVRFVLDIIRGLKAIDAQNQLKFFPKKSSKYILKLLNSAIANAENNFNLNKENLYVKSINADEGPALKRWTAKAFGTAAPIKKRSTHINIVLAELVETKKEKKSKKKEKGEEETKKIPIVNDLSKKVESEKDMPKTEGHKPEIIDISREGKHRHKENWDRKNKKEGKGFIKKMFSRKAV